ncbi:hypothetical protein [Microbacterium hydrocarbonoxydans]|uniref:hypothetical protein n=1 Tax=Microbacterium hydrocarbonoxydans TaxID=273678 RepID=UPI0013D94670|nr:hypothetical protein [Microbacterium hydrocarbonoxydans]
MNGMIPVAPPTDDEAREALETLGMLYFVACAYGGGTSMEWDHLRPLVEQATAHWIHLGDPKLGFLRVANAVRARGTSIG